MSDLPTAIITTLLHFSSLFSCPVFAHIKVLFSGHILSKGKRTIADLLRVNCLNHESNYSKFYNVFRRASWSPFKGSRILFSRLLLLVNSEVQIVIDSTIERRKGPTIKALGKKRDPVASSKANKVLCIGQEWLVASILVHFPLLSNVWACPFLTILLTPEKPLRSSKNKSDLSNNRHKKMTKWTLQIFYLLRRWLGKSRKCCVIADGAFACLTLVHCCKKLNIGFISRLRLDARIFEYPDKNKKNNRGRPVKAGKRIRFTDLLNDKSLVWQQAEVNWYGRTKKSVEYITDENLWYNFSYEPVSIRWVLIRNGKEVVALFSTDLRHTPIYIIESFVSRWKLEVTFEELRRHLGFETSQHRSDNSVDRISPCLLASFSLICLCGNALAKFKKMTPQKTAWYKKKNITFSDVLSALRQEMLSEKINFISSKNGDMKKNSLKELVNWLAAA